MTSIYDQVEKDLEARRDKHAREKARRREEVYQALPQIRDLDQNIRALGFEAARRILEDPGPEEARLVQGELESLKAMKEAILLSQGYPKDYLEDHHDCPYCQDKGYLEDGSRCSCYKQKLADQLYKMSNMEEMIKKENFATFDLTIFSDLPFGDEGQSPRDNMRAILDTVKIFLDSFPEKNDMNLLFYGATGQGKTFLSNAIARELLDRNYLVIYQTAFTLLDILERRKFHEGGKDGANALQYDLLFESDLLIIDDLGTELSNRFTQGEIFNIINTRLIRGKKTLISTNLNPGEISQAYSDRIFSRVFEKFVPMKFFGPDLRWENSH
ncbi:MAG: ATP-binding protein [Tissierellia bacterium]|nr:ATP-binding protein [Tissierellia bacterium]